MFSDTPEPSKDFFEYSAHLALKLRLGQRGPDWLDYLETVFKWRAKSLQQALAATAPHLKLMRVQEALASALGFPSTHALQQALKGLQQAFSGVDPKQWEQVVQRCESQWSVLLPLNWLARDLKASNLPLASEDMEWLSRVAQGLLASLGGSLASMRDALAIAWADTPSWAKLCNRTPLVEPLTEPLLTFEVEGDPTSSTSEGSFRLSPVGHWLWDNVLGSEEELSLIPQTTKQAKARIAQIEALLAQAPDLYVAYATLSAIYEEHHEGLGVPWTIALASLDRGISIAESCWPKGFKGTLSAHDLDNRPYLRMLAQRLSLELRAAHGWQHAQRTARRLMRLNPDDFGLVEKAPLLIGLGAAASTQKRLRAKALAHRSASGLLHAGLGLVYEGADRVEGLALMLESVFRVPEFGAILLGDPAVRPYQRYSRPISYEDPWDELQVVLHLMVTDPAVEAWMKAVLRDDELLVSERQLNDIIDRRLEAETDMEGRLDIHREWERKMREVAVGQAQRLLRLYPAWA